MRARLFLVLACAAGLCVGAAHAAPASAATVASAKAAPAAAAPVAGAAASAAAPAAAASAASPATASASAGAAPGEAVAPADAAPRAAAPASPITAPAPVYPAPLAGSSAGNLVQTILALCLVLLLLGGLAWFLKRYGPKQMGGSANLRLVGALSLGGRERILVVEVGEQWIVVGASPGRINALATLPRQEGVLPAQLSAHQPSAASFAEWLKQTIDKRNAK